MCMWVSLYVSMYMCMQVSSEVIRGVCFHEAGGIGNCEPPQVAAGTKSSSLQEQKIFLTVEHLFSPQSAFFISVVLVVPIILD